MRQYLPLLCTACLTIVLACLPSPPVATGSADPPQAASEAQTPTQTPTAEKPAETLLLSVSPEKDSCPPGEDPAFHIQLYNSGDTDLTLNLGILLANGKKQFPTALGLILTDPSGKVRTLAYNGPGAVAGRIDDFLVPLPANAAYTLTVPLKNFWCPATNEFGIKLPPGEYPVRATYEAKDVSFVNPGMEGVRLISLWKGTLTSDTATLTVAAGE